MSPRGGVDGKTSHSSEDDRSSNGGVGVASSQGGEDAVSLLIETFFLGFLDFFFLGFAWSGAASLTGTYLVDDFVLESNAIRSLDIVSSLISAR